MGLTPEEIQETELPRRFRGYDEDATEALLARAAKSLAEALAETASLRAELEGARSRPEGSENLQSIGDALLTAHRAGEHLIADARAVAERLVTEAGVQRDATLERARSDAAHVVADGERRLAAIHLEEERVRALVAAHRSELAAFVRRAIDELAADERGEAAEAEGLAGALQERLPEQLNGAPASAAPAAPTNPPL